MEHKLFAKRPLVLSIAPHALIAELAQRAACPANAGCESAALAGAGLQDESRQHAVNTRQAMRFVGPIAGGKLGEREEFWGSRLGMRGREGSLWVMLSNVTIFQLISPPGSSQSFIC